MARSLVPPDTETLEEQKFKRMLLWGCGAIAFAAILAVTLYRLLPPPCDFANSILLRNYTISPDGSLLHRADVYPSGYYYAADGVTRGCLCAISPCVRKCCDADEYIVPGERGSSCQMNPSPHTFDVSTLLVHYGGKGVINGTETQFRIVHGDVCSNGKFVLDNTDPSEGIQLLSDGRVLKTEDNTYLDITEYCMEEIRGYGGVQIMECFPPDVVNAGFTLYPGGMILSTPFLLCTFLVYATIPELRNIHGKFLMCNMFSLLMAYLVLTAVQLEGFKVASLDWCKGLGKVSHVLNFEVGDRN